MATNSSFYGGLMKTNKCEEMERFSLLFGLSVKKLRKIYSQVKAQEIVPLNFTGKIEDGDVILGEINEFEKKALCWREAQTDDILKEIISDLVCLRIANRLNLTGRFSFREGGKIVRNPEVQMRRKLLESIPANTYRF